MPTTPGLLMMTISISCPLKPVDGETHQQVVEQAAMSSIWNGSANTVPYPMFPQFPLLILGTKPGMRVYNVRPQSSGSWIGPNQVKVSSSL
jgi:hypothetical protein